MNPKKVYEYAILRWVPHVIKEEFINVGVLLYSRHHKFIGIRTRLATDKLMALDPEVDIALVEQYIKAFEEIALGTCPTSDIALMEQHERFRWLTANRSTMLQASAIHTGITDDAPKMLQQLFDIYT